VGRSHRENEKKPFGSVVIPHVKGKIKLKLFLSFFFTTEHHAPLIL
jgi:hypothetical protein